jgi:hypothetical protein
LNRKLFEGFCPPNPHDWVKDIMLMKKLFSLRTLLLLCAWPGAGTAQAAPGSVAAWGRNNEGQTTVPVAAQSGMTAIAAGFYHTVALKNDGGVVSWGYYYDSYNFEGDGYTHNYDFRQTSVPVAAQSGVTAIAAGDGHTVALKTNGSVVAWGYNGFGQTNVPVAAQSGVTAIAAGWGHTVALKSDGSVLAWGNNDYGQTTVPVAAQSGVTAIAAGGYHTVALKTNGSVVAWGAGTNNTGNLPNYGQSLVPMAAQSGVTVIAAGGLHTVALLGTAPPPLTITRSGANVILTWPTNATEFTLQSTTNVFPSAWSPVAQPAVTNAGQISVTVPTAVRQELFRLKSQ